jgi:hypothetical protein
MIAAIQTHGELLHWHSHIHVLITCGAFTPEGDFLQLPEFDMDRLLVAWQEAVFALYLAEFTQHIPPKGSHLIRYYGWYSNKSRGMRKKAEAEASPASSSEETAPTGSSQSWAMLIKRVYEVDPLCCLECGQMQMVSFIAPPQADVIEEVLKYCGLWQSRSPRAPPEVDELVLQLDAAYSGSSIDSPDPADSPRS